MIYSVNDGEFDSMTEKFPFLGEIFWGNSIYNYLLSLGLFLGGMVVLIILQKIVLMQIRALSKKTSTSLDDFVVFLIEKKILPILYVLALYFSAKQLVLSEPVNKAINIITIATLVIQITRLIAAVLIKFLEKHSEYRASQGEQTATKTMTTIVQLVVWSVGIVFLLDNLGFNVSAVIAGLGIGGVAVALAAQNILGDLFNYFVIFFDKPFREGDFVIVGDLMGTIEHIGIKTTRIRSLGGEELVFSNTDLTTSRLKNYKQMRERRVLFSLGVTYQTKNTQMATVSKVIKEIIQDVEDTRFDRAHFKDFGNFSLNIEVVYYVLNPDYNHYMNIQEKINLAIQKRFEQEGIEFAYPTQTLFVEQGN